MIKFLDIERITASYEPELSETVEQVIRSGRYLHGTQTAKFEEEFAAYCGIPYCVSVGNGLDALTLILAAMRQLYDWEPDDEVIVPALTFFATAEAVKRSGLKVVFCDVSRDNYLLDIAKVADLITPRTRAILPVHLYGTPLDVAMLRPIATQYGLKIVEDAAQAHGAIVNGKRTGTLGDAAAFSFYPGKNLGALGDAGAVVTQDKELANHIRVLANYGAKEKYIHTWHGVNSRMDELQAAVLRIKLRRLDADNARRREIASRYRNEICHTTITLPPAEGFADSVYHIFPILASERVRLQQEMTQCGVETLIHYPLPLHRQPAFSDYGTLPFPIAEQIAFHELSLPISPVMHPDEVERVIETINTCANKLHLR